jgi:hypothetical protein
MRRRWDYRGVGSAITHSKPTAYANGVPADRHEVGCALGDSQSDADETESGTLVEPANRRADRPSRIGAIGDQDCLTVTSPYGVHRDPDSDRSTEFVHCHPVGDCQRIADCQPVAVLISGRRACRNKLGFLVLVGACGCIACSRDSNTPSRAGTPSTSLVG